MFNSSCLRSYKFKEIMGKRNLYRTIAVVIILLFACFLFWIGKGHSLLFDNKDMTANGKSYKAAGTMRVTVDEQKPVLVKSGKRARLKDPVKGPWHSIKVEILDNDRNVVDTIEKKFSLSLSDMFLLNLPAFQAEDSNWIQKFEPPKRRR